MVISEAPGGPGGLGRGPQLQLLRSVERCGQHALIADTRPTFLTPRGGGYRNRKREDIIWNI